MVKYDFSSYSSLFLKVKPNSPKTEILDCEKNNITLAVKAPADKNKANIEIIKFFSKLTGRRARVKLGLNNRRKILAFD